MRFTACHDMADWIPEKGAGYESSTRPGGRDGATSVYQRGRATGRMVNGSREPNIAATGTRATPATASAPSAPRQSGSRPWTWSRMIARSTAAARKPTAMKRCTITFSMTGMWAKTHSGSHWPWRAPSEHTAHSDEQRSRRTTRAGLDGTPAQPTSRTARRLHPRKAPEASGAPSYPPSSRKMLCGFG